MEWGQDESVVRTRGGHAFAYLADDFDGGIALFDLALMLDSNLATT